MYKTEGIPTKAELAAYQDILRSWHSREPKIYFGDPAELLRWADKAKELAERYYELTG